ncbi:Putative flippase GtrA (transmembrane translocase of bactoprenol-linked glucose) [Streptomyces sp. 1222.2]|nr:Putative flippase GtrA (transmembrane translocase of bactoprenol-linked glucose) [Streptomyces sp. 1222.2]
MKPLLPSKSGAASKAQRTGRSAAGADGEHRPQPGPLATFARFVLCGGGVGLASGPAVALMAALMPWAMANALVTAASTLLCTELHARFTFQAGRRAGWRQHWQSAGSASAAYVMTCAATFFLHLLQPSAGMLSEQVVYLGASGLAGIGRFLVLHLVVFAGSSAAVQDDGPAGVRQAGEVTSRRVATSRPRAAQPTSEPSCAGVRTAAAVSTVQAGMPPGRSGRSASASAPRPLLRLVRPRCVPAATGAEGLPHSAKPAEGLLEVDRARGTAPPRFAEPRGCRPRPARSPSTSS